MMILYTALNGLAAPRHAHPEEAAPVPLHQNSERR
jgi:hypothetical protein